MTNGARVGSETALSVPARLRPGGEGGEEGEGDDERGLAGWLVGGSSVRKQPAQTRDSGAWGEANPDVP